MKTITLLILFGLLMVSCEAYHEEEYAADTNNIPATISLPENSPEVSPSALPLKSLVQVIVTTGRQPISTGSGVVLSSKGLFLTNFHVVDAAQYGNIEIWIAFNEKDPSGEPDSFYRTVLIRKSERLDLALLQLADEDDSMIRNRLFAASVAENQSVNLGEPILILGFPGIGQNTPTITRGIVSGWLDDDNISRAWIKTDAEVNRGNSGGLAVDASGRLIGIPTAAISDREVSGKISLIRPVHLLRVFLDSN